MPTVGELLDAAVTRLRVAAPDGPGTPWLDAELLLGDVIGLDRTGLLAHPETVVDASAAEAFERSVARRESGEPVAYIRGTREFHGLVFATDRRALVPRPETEALVDRAERELVARLTAAPRPAGAPPLRVVDVGTGSGTIAVTLAVLLGRRGALGDVSILATDRSAEALSLALENAVAHGAADGIAFVETDLAPAGAGPFALVLANLPYIRSADLPGLPTAVTFEPLGALDGGPDGLREIDRLLARLPELLEPGGLALLEIGADQGVSAPALVADRLPGWPVSVEVDLAGHPRILAVERPGSATRGPDALSRTLGTP